MQAFIDGWFAVATVISVTAALTMWINTQRFRSRRRAQQLKDAARALEAHYVAVSKLIDDPAFPNSAKPMLVALTEGISRKEVAEKLAAAFTDGTLFAKTGPKPPFSDELEKLYNTRRDLADAFHTAVASGLAALFLRWPENAALFERMSVEISTDVRKEGAVFRKLAEITKRMFDSEHSSGGSGGGIAAAAC
jgi:hypothetical protein